MRRSKAMARVPRRSKTPEPKVQSTPRGGQAKSMKEYLQEEERRSGVKQDVTNNVFRE